MVYNNSKKKAGGFGGFGDSKKKAGGFGGFGDSKKKAGGFGDTKKNAGGFADTKKKSVGFADSNKKGGGFVGSPAKFQNNNKSDERNKKTLFVKGVGKSMKPAELKGLHPDIVDVRVLSANAFLTFSSEAACAKAHKVLSARKVNGKPLFVDFCGNKSQNKPNNENNAKKIVAEKPAPPPKVEEVEEESDVEDEGVDDEELEDEDLLDEMDDEELGDEEESELDDEEEGAEDDEDDSEEDEETNEGPIKPVVSQNAAKKTNGVTPVAKLETKSILKKSDTPAKAAATSKKEAAAAPKKEAAAAPSKKEAAAAPSKKEAAKKESAIPERKGEKRKAPTDSESSQTLHSTKQPRLNDQTSILSEEERRREERNKKSLFVKGVGKSMKASDLKGLHPDVVDVRVVSSHAWLIFPSEAACAKAHKALSAKKVNGKPLVVDFCGSKSQNKPQSGGANRADRPLDPLRIVLSGISNNTTAENLQLIFPNSKGIKIWKRPNNSKTMAFITFGTEADARAAFKNGESLKVHGSPVDVFYARIMAEVKQKKTQEPKKEAVESKKAAGKKAGVKATPADSEDEDSDEQIDGDDSSDDADQIDSSEEGIEEESDSD